MRTVTAAFLSVVMTLLASPQWLQAQPRAERNPATRPIPPVYQAERPLQTSDFVRFDWTDAVRGRTVPVKVYFPADGPGPFPVIVFSHGLGGTREHYEYLGRQWSANGYVSVHLQHPGSDDSVWRGQARPMNAMRQAANGKNAIDRALDVRFVLDQLEVTNRDDATLKGKLDLSRVGAAGHSFGAQTALLAAGQRLGGGAGQDLSDPRVRAALPLSAPVPATRGRLDEAYAGIRVPVFLMTGTDDDSPISGTAADERRLPFDRLSSKPAYLLILQDGDHTVFSGRRVSKPTDPEHHRLIRLASTAFWDAHLKDDAAAKAWLAQGPFTQMLGEGGTFEER